MGNHPSLESAAAQAQRPIQRLLRPSNALGLSKAELDKRCQPSGLYPTCSWDEKAIRRLIGDGKLAARLKGNEQRQAADCECPICFLNYAQINSTRCCQAKICTECFLQVRPQKDKSATCPFCNSSRVQVAVAQALDEQAILAREREEQRVIEAEIRSRAPRLSVDALEATESVGDALLSDRKPPSIPSGAAPEQATAFGSSLEQNARVALLRARSSSVASESSSAHHPLGVGEVGDIAALAMTPEERAALEAEMKAQHSHPLAQRLQAEEEERRLQNELTYYQSQAARLRDLRARRELIAQTLRGATAGGAPIPDGAAPAPLPGADGLSSLRNGRDWNRIVEAFENSGNGTVQSLDDLVVLEAAIMLSMDEERRSGQGSDGTDDPEFDAAQHASQGFPLARSRAAAAAALAASGRPIGGGTGTTTTAGSSGEDLTQHLQSIMRSLQNPRRGRNRDRRSRLGLLASDASLETAAMLMRGISEEEQMAMAIAASLADSSSGPPSQGAPDTVDEASEDEEGEGDSAAADSTEGSAARPPPNIVWQGESQDPPGVSDVPLSAYRAYVHNITGDSAVSHEGSSSSAATADAPEDSQHQESIQLTLAVAAPAHQSVRSNSQAAREEVDPRTSRNPTPLEDVASSSPTAAENPNALDSVEAPSPA